MPFDLDLSNAQPLLDRMRATFTPAVTDQILLYAGQRVGAKAEQLVSAYPPASGKPLAIYYPRQRKDGTTYLSKFKSLKQQRLVMALIAQNKVPYRRTGTLGKSILSNATIAGAGLVIVRVGSNLGYAPYVIDRIMQSHYHMGTWPTIQDDIQRGIPALTAVAVNAVVKQVNERLSNG